MIMESRWLIGGPQSAERVVVPQQSEQTTETVRTDECPNPWHDSAPARARGRQQCPECPSTEGTYEGKTADQWRAMAQHARGASLDSFDRSDTDGALTQLASDTAARRYAMCAQLAEKDGLWEFPALFTLTGALVPNAVWIKTKLNKWVWRIGTGQTVTWFDPSQARSGARRRANDAAKGFALGTIRTRACVGAMGSGRGLSGLTSVGFYIGRKDGFPIEIVDDGRPGSGSTQYEDRY